MPQNTSHAVMAQRTESRDSLDDFPTPPWATRAFVKHVLGSRASTGSLSVLEPACGRGYMSSTLKEYFNTVTHPIFPITDFRKLVISLRILVTRSQ